MPPASVVLSLPVHPDFFWPGLLFPHVELGDPGGKCCLAGVDWSGGAGLGFSAGGSTRSGMSPEPAPQR